jgi:hypothetical protein
MADTADSKSVARKSVRVQIPPRVPPDQHERDVAPRRTRRVVTAWSQDPEMGWELMVTPRAPGDPRAVAEAKQACWALLMVTALPKHIADEDFPRLVRAACAESFFMNVRVLTDFYVMMTKDPEKQIHRHSFLPGWNPDDGREVRELRERWSDFATTQVAHLLARRIPDDADPIVNRAPERLRLIADDLLTVADAFVGALHDAGSGWESLFATAAADARAQL